MFYTATLGGAKIRHIVVDLGMGRFSRLTGPPGVTTSRFPLRPWMDSVARTCNITLIRQTLSGERTQ
ncbi:MAG: hypothetical protein Phog2KO_48090 [Phototrophicaceae bacterium]